MSPTAIVAEKYKVKDLSLADWGREEIILAEKEMPGLMASRAIRFFKTLAGRELRDHCI